MLNLIAKTQRSLSIGLGAIAGTGTAVLMLTVVPDLVARSMFGEAVYGMAESGIFLLVLIVFLGLPVAQVWRQLFYVGVIDVYMTPSGRRRLTVIRHSLSAVISAVFAWYATLGAISSTLSDEHSYAVIAYPIWPAKIVVAMGLILLTLQLVIDAVEAWSRSDAPAEAPVGASHPQQVI
ncbi:MAG: hypothetical protein A3J29_15425 [Acidobacteria bacterium RIFCSPLOWO2_12_FULL_67_14b]|nr:MAG: hypothetical protein A3J29_15425 [Acidobacteria bacterium RIFCSPLOWO2_12_FULL_67_14b]